MYEKLVLWARFHPVLVKEKLLPEIEVNCSKYGIYSPNAYAIFQKNKFAENSLYVHLGFAENDIPIGLEYTKIALRGDMEPEPLYIQDCHAKTLCFFTEFRMQPFDHAMCGHHQPCLIQFEKEIPQIIYDELYEISEMKPMNFKNMLELWQVT